MDRPTHISVSLIDLIGRSGDVQTNFRCSSQDRDDVDAAARKLNISTAQFIRMVVIQAARKVIAEVS